MPVPRVKKPILVSGKRRPRRKARSVEQERAHHEHAEVTVRGHPEAATRKERNCYAQRGCDDWIRTA
jgi:hypothetical protein